MALLSPGTQVTIIDESNYTTALAGTVPLIVLATAQDKTTPSGSLAQYTTAENAGKLFLITSQRELVNNYGKPNFIMSNGTPVHGHELNEYGLLAAYSALGISNAAYIMRADIDLNQLAASIQRPVNPVADGTLWLDSADTSFGIFEWNSATLSFKPIVPSNASGQGKLFVITEFTETVGGLGVAPLPNIGKPGDYAVVLTYINSTVYYKTSNTNTWVIVGSSDWTTAIGSGALFVAGPHTAAPGGGEWDTNPATPTGSVWFKTTTPNLGAKFVVKKYNSATKSWIAQVSPVYASDVAALYGLDQSGGGVNIASGTVYVQSDIKSNNTFVFKLYKRKAGVTTVTGTTIAPVFNNPSTFTLKYTTPGSNVLSNSTTITISGTAAADFVSGVNNASIPNISATVDSHNRVSITHGAGGDIIFTDNPSHTPLAAAGILNSPDVRHSDVTGHTTDVVASNWVEPDYVFSTDTPSADPSDGTLWYYNNPTEYDILINDGSMWRGYKSLDNSDNPVTDSRGFNLSFTDPAGPIVSSSAPTAQSAGTDLKSGDLWINTSNLEDFPKIYRYNESTAKWVLIDNTDHTTSNGIVFADARWSVNDSTDIITDPITPITTLLESSYVDADCPSHTLYPRGTLLFNTRRSGMNVKEFVVNHLSTATYKNAWVSISGNDANGVALLGRKAQRAVILAKMAAAIQTSVEALEETRDFNLMVAPSYPELASVLEQLNVNRKETAFILVDTPMRLATNSTDLQNFVTSSGDPSSVLPPYYDYMAAYYPSGYTYDLDGNNVVVPSTHMALRTIMLSDQKSYPWIAPAGTRRGVVDNVRAIGYIDEQTGLFRSVSVGENIRDILYPGSINPISVVDGSGIVIHGQKTRSANSTKLDRINAARLIVYLRRQFDKIARQYLFEPNDESTRNSLKNQIEKELNNVKVNRGLNDFIVLCDSTNNTPDRVDRHELWCDIAVEPIGAVEMVYIPVRIKNTGAIAAGL